MKYPRLKGIAGREPTLRSMLTQLGLGQIEASMAIYFMFMLPRTTDPDAPGVIAIIMGMQRGLVKLGCPIDVDGRLGGKTARCIAQVSGRDWYEKTWVQLMGDLIDALKAGKRLSRSNAKPLGDYKMTYYNAGTGAPLTHYALGALPFSTWCSDKNPQPGCTALKNICKPMDAATLEVFKDLQRQTNRVLNSQGRTLLDVDGRIGPKTMAAVTQIVDVPFGHCDNLSAVANDMSALIRSKADQMNAVAVSDPVTSVPSVAKPDGTVEHPRKKGIPFSWWGMAAIVVGGLVIAGAGDKKKPRKRKAKTSAKRTRKTTTRRRRRAPKRRITRTYY